MNYISKRAQGFQSSGIRKIFDLAANLKDPINFSIGQPDFGVNEEVKKEAIEAIKGDQSFYTPTQGIKSLRDKVSTKLKKENNIIADSEKEILITSGTSAAIFLALSTLIDSGDEVIIPDPYFVIYPELVKFLGGKITLLNTHPDFQIKVEELEKVITKKSKILILNSPNNPTGAVYSEKLLKRIVQVAKKNNLIVLSDEIYEKFIYDNQTHFSIGSIYPLTITVQGLSKSAGMPGWRLGWASGPVGIIEKMKELQQYTFVCAPSLVQYASLKAFDVNNQQMKRYQQKRDLIYSLLSRKFEIIKPEGAFYIILKVDDDMRFTNWVIKNNVLVVPGNVFSKSKKYVRLSYAVSDEQIRKGAEILLKYPFQL